MSDLDNKLREIIDYPSKTRFSKNDTDTTIAQIKQVFADEGYHLKMPVSDETKYPIGANGKGEGIDPREIKLSGFCMTGAGWYEKFRRLLEGPQFVGMAWTKTEEDILDAVRQAAGLEGEES